MRLFGDGDDLSKKDVNPMKLIVFPEYPRFSPLLMVMTFGNRVSKFLGISQIDSFQKNLDDTGLRRCELHTVWNKVVPPNLISLLVY